jgi:thioester reductase-like protein
MFLKVMNAEGDIAKEGLGLSTEHCGPLMTSHISLIFHITTSVSFQDTLRGNMKTNALPVIEVVRLCTEMGDVKAEHVSSINMPIFRSSRL